MTLRIKIENRTLWPGRAWWLGLLVILVVAGALRFIGYNFSLPYVDHPDEPAHMLAARAVMDTGSPKPVQMLGYPPAMIATDYLFVRYLQDPAQPVTSVLWMARLLSISVSLGNVILIGLLARQLAGDAAGLAAAALWAVAPIIVDFSRFATPDSYVTCFSLLAIYLILIGTSLRHRGLMTASLVAGLVAVLYKYQAIVLFPLILGLPLTLLHGASREERKTLLLHLLKLTAIVVMFGLWLVLIYPSVEVRNIPYFAAPVSQLALPSTSLFVTNLETMLAPLWTHPVWPLSLLGLAILLLRPLRGTVAWGSALVILAVLGLSFFSVSLFGVQGLRQFIFPLALLTVFHGAGMAGWLQGARWLVERALQPDRRVSARPVITAVALVASAVLLFPLLQRSAEAAHQHTLADQRTFIAGYMDASLPPAPHIADYENHKTLNRDWGGYPLAHDFRLVEVADLTDQPLEDWRAQGTEYAIVTYSDSEAIQSGAEDAYRDGVTLLKTFPPSPERRGPASAVYWLQPIPHRIDAQLWPINIVGYRLEGSAAVPGADLTLTLFWRAEQPLDGDYAVFNHLIRVDTGELVAQADGAPLFDLRRPTSTWNDPAEILISQPFTLSLPADLPPGNYELRTGFYRRSDGVRLQTDAGRDSAALSPLTIPRPA